MEDADKKQTAVLVPEMGMADLIPSSCGFLTGPIIPTAAPVWSSMCNSQNIVPSQRWESRTLSSSERRCSCQGPAECCCSRLRAKSRESRRALMTVLGKFETGDPYHSPNYKSWSHCCNLISAPNLIPRCDLADGALSLHPAFCSHLAHVHLCFLSD